jgi:hypothetical protein
MEKDSLLVVPTTTQALDLPTQLLLMSLLQLISNTALDNPFTQLRMSITGEVPVTQQL